MSEQHSDGVVSIAGGPIAAVFVAGMFGRFRDDIGATNVALVLAGVVVLAALAGRTAGIVTALTAAMSFNFFHTEPYHSLRIDGSRDVVTVVLLAVLGLFVAEIGAWRRRNTTALQHVASTAHALESAVQQVAAGEPSDAVFETVRATLVETLGLSECRFEAVGRGTAPTVVVLPRTGALVGTSMRIGIGGFELPVTGAAIAVAGGGTTFGHIVMIPDSRHGSTLNDRRAAVALADLYALALTAPRDTLRNSRNPQVSAARTTGN